MNYLTLSDVLKDKAESNGRVTFIESSDFEVTVSYRQLYNTALIRLFYLQQMGLKPGEEVVFYFNHNEEFIYVFWACILGGFVPVPVAVGISDQHKSKLLCILKELHNPHLLSDSKSLKQLQNYSELNKSDSDSISELLRKSIHIESFLDNADKGQEFETLPEHLAMIQFSSGSTRLPKGICLTHENLLVTMTDLGNRARYSSSDISLSWMPLTHDLGLIGFHLNMLLFGIDHYLMPPELFSRHPLLWLQKAAEKKATVLSSPNFGYKHYLKLYNSKRQKIMDLSHVRIIMNGAEPISVDLCH